MNRTLNARYNRLLHHGLRMILAALIIAVSFSQPLYASNPTADQINVPYFSGSANPSQGAIFWFGRVDRTSNYADVRIAYDDEKVLLVLHIFDSQLWYDRGASSTSDLTAWDAVTVYLDLSGNPSSALTEHSYRVVGQVSPGQSRDDYQQTFQGRDSDWTQTSLPITTTTGWRGSGFNNESADRGWVARFAIPFAGLGLSGPPPTSTVWRLGLALHDRDDGEHTPIPDQLWPMGMQVEDPSSWGQIHFSVPSHSPPPVTSTSTLTLRNDIDGISVVDAHVGGHSECGASFNPDFFDGWGDANYAGYTQINIQNQWDIADWPCFSKYYLTFPIESIPENSAILSATLAMQMFGSAGGPDKAKPSYIQVATVAEDWDEASITWNNAPLVQQNFSSTVVEPIYSYPSDARPVSISWDVSLAVVHAMAAAEPLRLVLYSTDGDYHSGKYFWSANATTVGPQLYISIGKAAGLPSPIDHEDGESQHPVGDTEPESPNVLDIFLPMLMGQ